MLASTARLISAASKRAAATASVRPATALVRTRLFSYTASAPSIFQQSCALPASAAAVTQQPSSSTLGQQVIERARELLDDLLGGWKGILLAVPKKRTTHRKKRMRSTNKGLKNRKDIVPCPGCGAPKLEHRVCGKCFVSVRQRLREAGEWSKHWLQRKLRA